MDEERLRSLLEEATVDCYNEEEEFIGVMCTLEDQLRFPLEATTIGEQVQVLGIDESHSDLRRGVVARVRKGGREYRVGLSELEYVDPDLVSAEWLAMYKYWLGLGQEG